LQEVDGRTNMTGAREKWAGFFKGGKREKIIGGNRVKGRVLVPDPMDQEEIKSCKDLNSNPQIKPGRGKMGEEVVLAQMKG